MKTFRTADRWRVPALQHAAPAATITVD